MANPAYSQQIADLLARGKPQPSYQMNALAGPYQQAHPEALNRLVPEDYRAGPLQKAQEAGISNANELAMQGPDGDFWRALKQFQDHFSANGANGGQV